MVELPGEEQRPGRNPPKIKTRVHILQIRINQVLFREILGAGKAYFLHFSRKPEFKDSGKIFYTFH